MFDIDASEHVTWIPDSRMNKRPPDVKKGCWVFEHIPTGKLLISSSECVTDDLHLLIDKCANRTLKIRGFMEAYRLDPSVRIYQYQTNGIRDARRLEKRLRESVSPTYLLMN